MKIICTVCARGGSKGVPGKNVRSLLGKPLIQHTLEQVVESNLFDEIAISSDSEEILNVGRKLGIKNLILRSPELASDKAAKLPVVRDCVARVEKNTGKKFDLCMDLDCTSPLRTVEDIKNCVQIMKDKDAGNLITAMPSRRSPYFNLVEIIDGKVCLSKGESLDVKRRQDAPKTYDMNASIYIWKRERLENSDLLFHDDTELYVMPEERSIDIDSEIDFKLVELFMKEQK